MSRRGLSLGAVTVLFLGTALGCGPGTSDGERAAPVEIRGVWTTPDPSYAGRAFEILDDALIFHTGEGEGDLYVITNLRREVGPDGVEYEIDHRGGEGGLLTLSFTFYPADTTIAFRNQPELRWIRDRESW
jgi:hypothetical protein